VKNKKTAKRPYKKKAGLDSNPNPTHKEDFEKALQLIVPQIKPKGIKSNRMLDED
jgi:hypothetical protein